MQIENKLSAMEAHSDTKLDRNTLTIRAGKVRNEQSVQDVVDLWEDKVSSEEQWNNADVDIRVISDSTGEVVADQATR